MKHRDVELLAIGGGPANLALAVALEELAPDLAANSLIIEQAADVSWQQGLLFPEAESQVSFLKDLVTYRNPRSKFTFVNYLHSVGRLSDFINMGSFWPFRQEISEYFRWVARQLDRVRLECSQRCVAVEPFWADGHWPGGWLTRLADGSTVRSRHIVFGTGRDIYIPPVFDRIQRRRLIHSSEYRWRIAEIPSEIPYHVVVIGGAQSAAEMFDAVQRDLPNCRRTLVMKSIAMKTYENSKFTNELYFPGFVDTFFSAQPAAREQILREMHTTNYSALSASMLSKIYHDVYLDRLAGKGALRVITMADVTAAEEDNGEIVLTVADRKAGGVEELRCDLVLLGTGYVREMPALVRRLATALGLDQIEVTRNYRLRTPGTAASCYLQGVNEATHGIADSLLSVLAARAADITLDILADRSQPSQNGQPSQPSQNGFAGTGAGASFRPASLTME
jgi:L-ornithine N5-monooxygenase